MDPLARRCQRKDLAAGVRNDAIGNAQLAVDVNAPLLVKRDPKTGETVKSVVDRAIFAPGGWNLLGGYGMGFIGKLGELPS